MRDDREPVLANHREDPSVEMIDSPSDGEEEASEASDTETVILAEDDSDLMDQSSLQERVDHAGKIVISEVISLNISSPGNDVITID